MSCCGLHAYYLSVRCCCLRRVPSGTASEGHLPLAARYSLIAFDIMLSKPLVL
jgi:hypothetical protein